MYPHNSTYAFSENRLIDRIELEGRQTIEFQLPYEVLIRPTITLPRLPTAPTLPIPPITPTIPHYIPLPPSAPQAPSVPKLEINEIDWNNPPSTPADLGKDWEEITSPKNKSGNHREFKNKETGEKIRFDKGKEGKDGYEGKDHWHRYNPNSTGKNNEYLDKDGNPVKNGSGPSHIVSRNKGVLAPEWKEYYKKKWQYNQEMKEYYKKKWQYNHEKKEYDKKMKNFGVSKVT